MHALKKILPAILFLALWLVSGTLFGQDTSAAPRKPNRPMGNGSFLDASQPTESDYLQQFGLVYEVLNRVNASAALGYEITIIDEKLSENDSTLLIVKENLSRDISTLNVRNLQMFEILLSDVQAHLQQSQSVMERQRQKLTDLRNDMVALRKDTLLRQLFRDSTARKAYLPQITELRHKWAQADSSTKASLTRIGQLESRNSRTAILAAELRNQVDDYLRKINFRTFSKEVNFLWEQSPAVSVDKEVRKAFRQSLRGERKALQYYYDHNGSARWMMLFIGLLFFWWVSRNFRYLKNAGLKQEEGRFEFLYLNSWPLAASAVFALSLAPLFDLHPPAAYVESMQFLLMIALSILFWPRWPRRMLIYWGVGVLLFLLFSFTQFFIVPGFGQRMWLLALNAFSVLFGLFFLYRARKALALPGFVRIVAFVFIALNLFSVLFNVFGRFTLARILGSAGIFGFVQIIGLAAFVQIAVEAVLLQIQRGRLKNGYTTRFEHTEVERKLRRLMTFLALVLWVMIFATNLNIYSSLYENFSAFLSSPRNVGNTSFTFGSVATFFVIIWVANLLQQYTSYFFGDTDDEFSEDNKGQRSRLLISRLILLSLGFLLAVAASGLPIDKITIVLGALGVGIGLGLQNIVNNLVSGVILIFERPMQIGDTIEVGERKGKVKGIGIRSSKILTPEGAEVIVPNGDLLSQHIVNWTLSNNHVRVDLPLKVDADINLPNLKSLIIEILSEHPQVLKKYEPVIIVSQIGDKSIELNVRFWCADISKVDITKSELWLTLSERFQGQGFNML